MTDTVKIRMTLSTRYVGSKVEEVEEIDREEWESMSGRQQDSLIEELYNDFLSNNNYGGVTVEDGDD